MANYYNRFFLQKRPGKMRVIDATPYSDFISIEAGKRAVNYKNCVEREFSARLTKTYKLLVDAWLKGTEKCGVVRKLAEAMVKVVSAPEDKPHSWPPRIQCLCSRTKEHILPAAWNFCAAQREKYKALLPITASNLKEQWFKYYPWMLEMISIIEVTISSRWKPEPVPIPSLSVPEEETNPPQTQQRQRSHRMKDLSHEQRKRLQEKRKRRKQAQKMKKRLAAETELSPPEARASSFSPEKLERIRQRRKEKRKREKKGREAELDRLLALPKKRKRAVEKQRKRYIVQEARKKKQEKTKQDKKKRRAVTSGNEGKFKRLRMKNKLFTLVPVPKPGIKFLSINTKGLLALIELHNRIPDNPFIIPPADTSRPSNLTRSSKRLIWNIIFDFRAWETHKDDPDQGATFDCYVDLDKCTINPHFIRPTKGKYSTTIEKKAAENFNRELKPEWLEAIAAEYPGADVDWQNWLEAHCSYWSPDPEDYGKEHPPPNTHGKLLLAVDPGTGTPLTVTELGDCKSRPKVRSFSKSRYLKISGRQGFRVWHEAWKRRYPELKKALEEKPSLKTARPNEPIKHALHLYAAHFGAYSQYLYRSKLRKERIQKQRAHQAMIKWILAGKEPEDVFIWFGDGSAGWYKSAISRDLAPFKALARIMDKDPRYRFINTSEYRTSQSCSCQTEHGTCYGQLQPARFRDSDGSIVFPKEKCKEGDFCWKPWTAKFCTRCLSITTADVRSVDRNVLETI